MICTICVIIISFSAAAQFRKLPDANAALSRLKPGIGDLNRVNINFDLACYYIEKPGEKLSDLDSALDLLKHMVPVINRLHDPATTGKYYLLQSKVLRERNDPATGRVNVDRAIKLFGDNHLYELEADAIRDLNQYYPSESNEQLRAKIPLLQKMIALYDSAGAKELQAEGLIMLGDLYSVTNEYAQGVITLNKAIAVYQSIHHQGMQVAYDALGICYLNLGDIQRSVEYGLLAVKTAHQVGDTNMDVTLYNRLGYAFYTANMDAEAAENWSRSFEAAKRRGQVSDMILVGSNLSEAYLALGKPEAAMKQLVWLEKHLDNGSGIESHANFFGSKAKVLIELHRYPEAWETIKKMMTYTALMGAPHGNYVVLTKYYLATKNYDKLSLYADSLQIFDKMTNSRIFESYAHKLRFKSDSTQGNLIAAIRDYQAYKRSEDSSLNEKNKNEISWMNIVYETGKKEDSIQASKLQILALQKEDGLKSAQIKTARFNRNVTIAGALMLLVLSVLIYNQYRIKKNSNKVLLSKQEEINSKNLELQQLLNDKEWLMKELHHRVKNNLQLVMSLLNTQSDTSDNAESFAAVNEIRQRIFSMSLVHQKLYQSNQMSVVNMYTYIPELIDYLKDSFVNGGRVRFELKVDRIELDVVQAVSVGLILNELVTNSFKHAFMGQTGGLIQIGMHGEEDGTLHLMVRDNGSGFPGDIDLHKRSSMGMQLIDSLTQQLRGKISFTSEHGVEARLTFKIK